MPPLPKIALARLKAHPGGPESSGPPLAPGAFHGADHPDANLLAALVEKALTEGERAQVLNHLIQCAECREVAALAVSAESGEAETICVAAGRERPAWHILRWGALAAALGTLAAVVMLHPGVWNRRLEISKGTHPPVPAGSVANAPVSAPPSVPPAADSSELALRAHLKAPNSVGELGASGKVAPLRQDLARNDRLVGVHAKPTAILKAPPLSSAVAKTQNAPSMNAGWKQNWTRSAVTATGQAPSSVPSPAAGKPGAAGTAANLSLGSQARLEPLDTIMAGPAAPQAAPEAAVRTSHPMMALAHPSSLQGSRQAAQIGAAPMAAIWKISSDGRVQRFTSGGKAWQDVHVANGIEFRAIAALGADVWVGGTGGALFHSADMGATWTRVDINFEGGAVTETITGMQSNDPQHLTVTTASGSHWASEDGGEHWQRKP